MESVMKIRRKNGDLNKENGDLNKEKRNTKKKGSISLGCYFLKKKIIMISCFDLLLLLRINT